MSARHTAARPPASGHNPVMMDEVLTWLAPQDGDLIVDGTFGGGGYTRAILQAAKCSVMAIDRDLDAILRAEKMALETPRLTPLLGRFGEMDALVVNAGHTAVDGVVLDIGVSSFQIDEGERGFSFMKDGPLDMRMGAAGPTAADVVNTMSDRDLSNIIFRLGEEKQARRIARHIVQRRAQQPFETTADLADVRGRTPAASRRPSGDRGVPFAGRPHGQAVAARPRRQAGRGLSPHAAGRERAGPDIRTRCF